MKPNANWGIGLLMVMVLLAAPSQAATTTVHVYNFEFSTNPVGQPVADPVINVGDTIEWVWDSGFHSTTSVAGLSESWDSGLHSAPFAFDHTFTNVGAFPYYCLVHGADNGNGTASGMSGVITVVPEPATGGLLLGAALLGLRRRR